MTIFADNRESLGYIVVYLTKADARRLQSLTDIVQSTEGCDEEDYCTAGDIDRKIDKILGGETWLN